MKIKPKYPTAGQKTLVDKRGLGFAFTTRRDRLTFDPQFVRLLTSIYLRQPTFTLGAAVGDVSTMVSMFVDVRNDMIRGNAFPVSETVNVTINKFITALKARSSLTDQDADTIALVLARLFADSQIVELVEGMVNHSVFEVSNTLRPLFTYKTGDSILAQMIMADGVYAALIEAFDEIKKAMRPIVKVDKGGFRSADINTIGDQIIPVIANFDRKVRALRAAVVPKMRSTYIVVAEALTNPAYAPTNISESEIAQIVTYANTFYGLHRNAMVPKPRIRDEQNAKKVIGQLEKALSKKEACMYESIATTDLEQALLQYNIKMPMNASTVSNYFVTQWGVPAMATVTAAVVTPYKDAIDLVTVDNELSDSCQAFFDAIISIDDLMNTAFARLDISLDGYSADVSVDRMSRITPYADKFRNRLLLSIAINVCNDFSVNLETVTFAFEYRDVTNRRTYTAAAGGEARFRHTDSPAKVIAGSALTHATGESFYKHPSALRILPGATCAATGIRALLGGSRFKEICGHTDYKNGGVVIPATSVISSNMLLVDGTIQPIQFTLADLFNHESYAITDVYLEIDDTVKLVDADLKGWLTDLLAMTAGNSKRSLLRQIFWRMQSIATSLLGDDVYRAAGCFQLFPDVYYSQRATQSMKLLRAKNEINAVVAMLDYFGFSSTPLLSTALQQAYLLNADELLKE